MQARHRLTELEKGARIEEIDRARARVAARAKPQWNAMSASSRASAKLVEQKLVSQTQLDTARAARDASRASAREAQAQLTELLRGTRVEEVDQARAALAAAQSARRQLEVNDARLGRACDARGRDRCTALQGG